MLAAASQQPKAPQRKRVIDGVAPEIADSGDDFASPPILTTADKRGQPAASRKRTVTCSNCGQPGHTKKRCPAPKRNKALRALDVRVLPKAQRVQRDKRDRGEGCGDPLQNDDASDGEESSDVDAPGDESEEQEEEEAKEDLATKYNGCVWTPYVIQQMPAAHSSVADATRSPPSARSAQAPSDFHGAPAFKLRPEGHAKNIPRECETEAEFVNLLLNDGSPYSVMAVLVEFTNMAGRENPRLVCQTRFRKWQDTDIAEMLTFFAICTYLGVVKVQNRKAAWKRTSVFYQPWLRQRMSLKRFECLVNALNAAAAYNLSDHRLEQENAEHSFWQIQVLVDFCNRKSAFYWHMGRLMSLDEAVIPFKGHHRARCYNKNKPSKYHLKKFGLTCAKTGYNYAHYFYEGKGEERPANIAATTWPIVKLLDACPELLNANRILAVDNWFTSAAALTQAKNRGVELVGTMRPSRLHLESAKGGTFPLDGALKGRGVQRGEFRCYTTTIGEPAHTHYVTAWQDKQPVIVLSSYPPHLGRCIRKVREGTAWTAQTFERPSTFSDYNSAMGGTDLHDMRLAFIRTTVKSRRWQVPYLYISDSR